MKEQGLPIGQMVLSIMDVISAPTVEERKTGKWIIGTLEHKFKHDHRDARQCSECGAIYFHYANDEDIEYVIPNYCPNCGARMEANE